MNTPASTPKKSLFSHKSLKIIPAIFISIYLIIWGISSPVSKYFIEPVLQEQGLTLSSEASIYYNPFLSQLTIKDFALFSNEEKKVFSLDKLTVRLTLYRLLFDEVVVSEFELNDAYLNVVKTPSQLIIAGIDLNKESDATPEEKTPETVSEPLPFQLILPRLSLNTVNIELNNNEINHQINIDELLISQVKADLKSQTALLSLQSVVDGTALELTADAVFDNGQGEVNSQLSLNGYPIQKVQPYVAELSELSGLLSFTSQQKLTIASDIVKLHVNKAELSNTDLIVGYQQQFVTLKNFETNIDDLLLTLSGDEITELSGMSQVTLNDAEVHYEKASQKLAYIKQLALQDISFYLTNGEPQVKIANFIVDEIYGSKNEDTVHPPIVTLKQFSVKDVFANAKQLSIDTIILDSLQSNLILNEESALANLVSLPIAKDGSEKDEAQEEMVAVVEVADPTQDAPFIISLNEFSLINDNQLTLLDNSVEPMMQSKVIIDTLTLGALSNAVSKQEEQTPFELKGRINKYAHFDFKGFTLPFSQTQKHHLEGSLQELSLPAVSRYMKKAVNMELKSGQLNTDINVTLTGEELNGKILILLRSLETAVAGSDEAGSLIEQGALPFNMALGMLKDGHGDVELDVPLSGSTSDPNFGMSSIVTLITQKAIWMATKEYVMTTFVPYANVVSVAMSVGEFALKLRFDDLIYQTKQIEPNEAQQAYLQGFIALMQDKEKTRVNICGISVPGDINLSAGTKITDAKHINQLKEIAEQREAAFKDYIIEHGGIASSRLLLCSPKIDSSENAQPRIELSV
ncbi:DUF748 domain-containing protein [Colwellia sp. 4_MG-2023]|uniref:DUF748 domain-containing protein n=1 Tax=unclassified Colwellia TaxID=196834 RepID=UPI0026E359C3|nr:MULTISPECIES: DUF748 domain-containing protein [unclassified Colwellia]MDO6507425.1 DUF748 domain-containing protein [Colwellia sp. 5_MG-2023]MDO6556155.1 DUF748 domain-containing protein [Colwellia sp. 4_MG-2023]